MTISIEVPVVSGAWLIPTIESVLNQSSREWRLHLLWDGGDELSKQILQKIEKHPRATVFYTERMGIASARHYISERSEGDWILPLDHDDVLHKDCVRRFLEIAKERPWAGILRARRAFVDDQGVVHQAPDWFPFEGRKYFRGMTRDLYNHAQPMIIRRTAFLQTSGWDGFPEYLGAGEDCDMFARIEEVGEIELIDEILYFYRLHDNRTSNKLGGEPAALDMWRRIADKALQRRQIPLQRVNDTQPFEFRDTRTLATGLGDIDFVVPFWESDESELDYPWRRPTEKGVDAETLRRGGTFRQALAPEHAVISRLEIFCTADEALHGTLRADLQRGGEVLATGSVQFSGTQPHFENSSIAFAAPISADGGADLVFTWIPAIGHESPLLIHTSLAAGPGVPPPALMRLFQHDPGASRRSLDRCIASLKRIGIADDQIHIVEKRQSASENRNDGFSMTSRPYVCYVDDDVEAIDAESFTTLLDAIYDLDADLVGPKLLDAEGKIFCAAPYFEDKMPRPRGIGEDDHGQFDFDRIVTWLPSTCLLIRRSVGLAAGPWDTHYTGSQMEDIDYVLKARSRGFRCAYIGRAAVRHHNLQRNYRMSENLPYFHARWRGRPELLAEPPAEES